MKAKNEDISESYMLAGCSPTTESGSTTSTPPTSSTLHASSVGRDVAVDESRSLRTSTSTARRLRRKFRAVTLATTTSRRSFCTATSKTARPSPKGRIREYRAKGEGEHGRRQGRPTTRWSNCGTRRKPANGPSVPSGGRGRPARTAATLREEADHYLDLIEQSLKGTQESNTCSASAGGVTA